MSFQRTISRPASDWSGMVSSSTGRMRHQASGKTTEARAMRPPESARAALTASAIASRVGNVAPEGPAAVEPAGYRKCRASSKPAGSPARTRA